MSVFYMFIDGIGFGQPDPDINPFTRFAELFLAPLGGKALANVPNGTVIQPVDASLGFPGLPQSATGQTALWTGVNGPKVMGRHMTGFPGPTLIRVIQDHSIIKVLKDKGKKAALANAFSEAYLERIARKPRLTGASTHVHLASGQPLKNLDDLENRKALYMDITHEVMHRFFPHLKERFPVRNAEEVGRDAGMLARDYDMLIYEFFLSDKAGHNQSFEEAEWAIRTLESFLKGLCEMLRPEDTLLITSDHGNLEDLSTKTHTKNPVLALAYGRGSDGLIEKVRDISDFPSFIYELLGVSVPRA